MLLLSIAAWWKIRWFTSFVVETWACITHIKGRSQPCVIQLKATLPFSTPNDEHINLNLPSNSKRAERNVCFFITPCRFSTSFLRPFRHLDSKFIGGFWSAHWTSLKIIWFVLIFVWSLVKSLPRKFLCLVRGERILRGYITWSIFYNLARFGI